MPNILPPPQDGFERYDLASARAKDAGYGAVYKLWVERRQEGRKKTDIAKALDKSPSWVSRALAGPANWTLETLGSLADALDGVVVIEVKKIEDAICDVRANFDFYEAHYGENSHVVCPIPSPLSSSSAVSIVKPSRGLSSSQVVEIKPHEGARR